MQPLPDTHKRLLVLSLVLLAAGAADRRSACLIQVLLFVFHDYFGLGYSQLL